MQSFQEDKQSIKDFAFDQLCQHFHFIGEKTFRAKQVFEWIYKKNVFSFDDMRNLSSDFRDRIKKNFILSSFLSFKKQTSEDGTIKFLFNVGNHQYIETVLIPVKGRFTVCVSTQVGCKFQCAFCASGANGLSRNLQCGEIIEQILYAQKEISPKKVTHIVFMGVGEPFDNYENFFRAVKIINSKEGMNIAARRITISTCGLIPEIERFSKEGMQVELAISLHASNDKIRNQLMPINKKYPMSDLLEACRQYTKKTNRQITFEYVLFKDLNSSEEIAFELAKKLRGMLCKVNLIVYNPTSLGGYQPPHRKDVFLFKKILIEKKIHTTIRASRGQDVSAACGQLRFIQNISN